MARKFFSVVLLALVLVLVNAGSQAEAGTRYVGSYSDGSDVYLLTHTVYIQSRRPYTFSCDVSAAGAYLHYSFFPANGSPYYRNSEGYEGYVFGGQSPVAENIYRYVVDNY